MTEQQLRQKIVSTARGWLGRRESDGSHRAIIDLYNAHKPLARGYQVQYTDAWCATFGSAVAIQCGLTNIIPTECGCERQIALFRQLGSWVEDDSYTPAPGDYIFYDWQDSGTGDCTGSADHVGIVEAVGGGKITVIEGNYSNSVKRRTLKINGRYIRGYGVPDYASQADKEEETMDQATFDKLMDDWLQRQGAAAPSEWSQEARTWAEENGIINGNDKGQKMYRSFCTREQLAVILYRIVKQLSRK